MGSAYGSLQASRANARSARYNADLLRVDAKDAKRRGGVAMSQLRQQGRQVVSSQRTAFASQNVDVNSGNAAKVQADTAAQVDADVDLLRENAQREAWGRRAEARIYDRQAKLAERTGLTSAFVAGLQESSQWLGLMQELNWFKSKPASDLPTGYARSP